MVEVYQYVCVGCDASEASIELAYTRTCRKCAGTAFVHNEVYLDGDLRRWALEAAEAPAEAWKGAREQLAQLAGSMRQAAIRPDPDTWRAHARAYWRLLAWLFPVTDERDLTQVWAIEGFAAVQVQWWSMLTFETAVADPYRAFRRLAAAPPDQPSPGSIGHAAAMMEAAEAFLEAALSRWDHARFPLTDSSANVLRAAKLDVLWWLLDDTNLWLPRPQRGMLAMNHATLDPAVSNRAYDLRRALAVDPNPPRPYTCPSCGSDEARSMASIDFCPRCIFDISSWVIEESPFVEGDKGGGLGLGDAADESVSLVMEFDADPSFDTEANANTLAGDASASIEVLVDDDPTTDEGHAPDDPTTVERPILGDAATSTASVVMEIMDTTDEASEASIMPGETDRYDASDVSDELSTEHDEELSGSYEIVHDGPSQEAEPFLDHKPMTEPEFDNVFVRSDDPAPGVPVAQDEVFDDSWDGESEGGGKKKKKGGSGNG